MEFNFNDIFIFIINIYFSLKKYISNLYLNLKVDKKYCKIILLNIN